jgi:hypothetical protein
MLKVEIEKLDCSIQGSHKAIYTVVHVRMRAYASMYRDGWIPSAQQQSRIWGIISSHTKAEIYLCNKPADNLLSDALCVWIGITRYPVAISFPADGG